MNIIELKSIKTPLLPILLYNLLGVYVYDLGVILVVLDGDKDGELIPMLIKLCLNNSVFLLIYLRLNSSLSSLTESLVISFTSAVPVRS